MRLSGDGINILSRKEDVEKKIKEKEHQVQNLRSKTSEMK